MEGLFTKSRIECNSLNAMDKDLGSDRSVLPSVVIYAHLLGGLH